MATNTYVALRKTTVTGSPVASVTLSLTGISGYTDLVLVISGTSTSATNHGIQFNSDTAFNYSTTLVYGDGTSAGSTRKLAASGGGNQPFFYTNNGSTGQFTTTINIQNYSNTTTYKTGLSRFSSAGTYVWGAVGLWQSTDAITSITYLTAGGDINSGSTFSLYGIRAEGVSPAAKATGGAIYSDADYYYHAFASTGTFTPLSSITADVLVVAGGGGGAGGQTGGGGGAGGVTYYASQSLTATGYTCTVGAGGAGQVGYTSSGGSGVNSQFAALTASVGGGGGGYGGTSGSANGLSGGSGGGAGGTYGSATTRTGGSPTSGQGLAGGNTAQPQNSGGAGGGGAGVAGQNNSGATGRIAGNGGNGISTYSSWGVATGVGQNVSDIYYIAGGGGGRGGDYSGTGGYGGGAGSIPGSGQLGTGGGGAAHESGETASNGGSGIVIVRYLKA